MSSSRRRDRSSGGTPARTVPDACPGAWRRHEAADGALARFRPAGGCVTAAELRLLAGAAVTGGAPLELTSRGSVQVRGLSPSGADDLGEALRGAGAGSRSLLDTRGRELPCGLLASPRSTVLDDAVAAVADGLRERPDTPGRFLVALDDGTGDVAGLDADVTVLRDGGAASLWLAGLDSGVRVEAGQEATLVLAAVDAFAAVADGQWRVSEVPDGAEAITTAVRDRLTDGDHRPAPVPAPVPTPAPAPAPAPAGFDRPTARDHRGTPVPAGLVGRPGGTDDHGRPVVTPGGALEVLPRLGEIELRAAAALVELLATAGTALRITPWRSLVLRGLPDPDGAVARLAAAGLETDPDTPWAGLSACVGAPRCAKSLRDVRAELTSAVASGHAGRGNVGAHWIGCARACGTPGGRVAVVEALRVGPPGAGAYRTVVRSGRTR